MAASAAHADPNGTPSRMRVVDDAGRHRASRLVVPRNVRWHVPPPCTPERQPIAAFGPLVREAVANDTFDRLSDLRRRITRRCGWLARNPDVAKAAVGFHRAVNLETQ